MTLTSGRCTKWQLFNAFVASEEIEVIASGYVIVDGIINSISREDGSGSSFNVSLSKNGNKELT